MGQIIEINTDILTPDHKRLTYKLNQVKQFIDEIEMGYELIQGHTDVEEGEFLIENGIAMAQTFLKDSLMITRGPDFIDWL